MDHRGQQRTKQCRIERVEDEVAAEQSHVGGPSGVPWRTPSAGAAVTFGSMRLGAPVRSPTE